MVTSRALPSHRTDYKSPWTVFRNTIPSSFENASTNSRKSMQLRPSDDDDDDDGEKDYGSQRVNDALKQWYNRNIRFTFEFPENFKEVPATSANEKNYNDNPKLQRYRGLWK
jgi:hypothetical protein